MIRPTLPLLRLGKFALVGLVNTAISLLVIALLLRAGFGDYPANIAGYACGLVNSFAMNRRFTFQRAGTASVSEASRFLLAVGISYAANLAVLALARALGLSGSLFAHLPAMAIYTVTFYLISSCYVFREGRP
ncbi:MAG: GtrA family protein [Porphyrobacter sp.]|nr:GtrA family protein [Porphyrobacter sp.]